MTDPVPARTQDMDPERFRDDPRHGPFDGPRSRPSGPAGGREVPAVPGPLAVGVLRATRAYLFPDLVRTGLEMALGEIYCLAMDEGIHDLPEHPALALSRAILADLEHTLAVVPELDQLTHAGSIGEEELTAVRAVKDLEGELARRVAALREALD